MGPLVARRGRLLFGVSVIIALLASPSWASATITVNTTADVAASPSECLGAPADCSLRRAVDKAAANETIVVPKGTYTLSAGSLNIAKSLTIQGAGARTTTVSGNGLSSAFFIFGAGVEASISGLKITGGNRVTAGASLVQGGAIRNADSTLKLDRTAVADTVLDWSGGTPGVARGGGIANFGVLTITNSTISGNVERATGASGGNFGAGLFNSGGTVIMTNSTIAANSQVASAGATSGGAAIRSNGGAITLKNVTISDNQGSASVDSVAGTLFNLNNTIVANGASGNCSGALTSQGHNLESADECGFHAAGDQINKDPLLGPLANNGGPTDTEALSAKSPAIDKGDPSACPPTDQRGLKRPQGPACDIGAFELDYIAPVIAQLRQSHKTFAVDPRGAPEVQGSKKHKHKAKRGTTFSYQVSEASRVLFAVERKSTGRKSGSKCVRQTRRNRRKHRCTRYTSVGSFAQQAAQGRNSKPFSGRIGTRKLRPGSYRVTLVARDPFGNTSKRARLSFKVVRR